jgi:ABC-2 type transport system ATP-binding protein
MVFSAALDDLKETHRCLTVRFAEPRAQPPVLAPVLTWQGAGQEWTAVCRGRPSELASAIAGSGARIVADRVPSLDEIFVARVGAAKED